MLTSGMHLLTTSIVARILGRSEASIRNLERRGILTAVRAGNNNIRLFDSDEVERLAAEYRTAELQTGVSR